MVELYEAYADYEDIAVALRAARRGGGRAEVGLRGRARLRPAVAARDARATRSASATGHRHARRARPRRARRRDPEARGLRRRRPTDTWAQLVDDLVTKHVEPTLIAADVPARLPGRAVAVRQAPPRRPERWSSASRPSRSGMEIANAFTELNDPDEQRAPLRAAARARRGRRRGGPALRRGVPPGARARHAADRRHRHRDRPPRDGADRRALDPRGRPVPGDARLSALRRAAEAASAALATARATCAAAAELAHARIEACRLIGRLALCPAGSRPGHSAVADPRPMTPSERGLRSASLSTTHPAASTLPSREGTAHQHVRAIHRASPPGGRPRPGGGPDAQAQLHRHRAHPARPAPRGGGPGSSRAGEPRHHRRARPRAGRAHRRLGRGGHLRPDPVHAARQEGAGAGAARGAEPRPQLHRHRAHPARPRARERGRRRAHPARLRRRLGEDPQRGHPHAVRPRRSPPGQRPAAAAPPVPAGAQGEGKKSSKLLDQFGRNLTKLAADGKLDPVVGPRDGDRADHADPLAPHEEQPGADRRAGRRQDGRRRGPRAADHERRRARAAEEQADLHARPGGAGRRLEVPRRVRGAPQEGDEGDHPARRHHPVHRRAPQPRRRRRGRGRDRRGLDPQAGARARRAADDRRDDARRVPQVPRARLGAGAPLPADPRRPALDGRDRADPARPARPLRAAPQGEHHRRGAVGGRRPGRPLHLRPLPAGQGDRPDRRGRLAHAHQVDDVPARVPRARGRDRGDAARRRRPRSRPRSSRRPRTCATRSASSRRRSASWRSSGSPASPATAPRSARRRSPTSSRCGPASRSSS